MVRSISKTAYKGIDRYEGLNIIRALSAIGIILMHVRANSSFMISGFIYNNVIDSLTNITYLFMLLSAFSMCCGYYEKVKNGTLDLEHFYKRRYQRIWPFFAILSTCELIVEHKLTAFYEWIADLTLAFGLLPNPNISVVGVGWFLGVIFVFYMIFPFFVFLFSNKKRAWFVLIITIVLNILCRLYFFNSDHVVSGYMARTNFIYCSVYFALGGIIYLYRKEIIDFTNRFRWLVIGVLLILVFLYFAISKNDITLSLIFVIITVLGVSQRKNDTKRRAVDTGISFLSDLSMEIYLSHMFIFRIAEKIGFNHLTGSELANYCIICVVTVIGAILVSAIFRKLLQYFELKTKNV